MRRPGDPFLIVMLLSLAPWLLRGRLEGWLLRRDGLLPRAWSDRMAGVAAWILVLLAAVAGAMVYWTCSATAAVGLPWLLAAGVEMLRTILNGISRALFDEDWD